MKVLLVLKTYAAVFVAVLAIGIFTNAAQAQFQTERVQFDAPFAFEYGSHLLPAGRYVVSRQYPRVLLITDGPHSVVGAAQRADDRVPISEGKVVFRKYGQRYFLSEVWIAGNSSHFELNRSKQEKRIEKEAKLAMNDASSTLEVAALNAPR